MTPCRRWMSVTVRGGWSGSGRQWSPGGEVHGVVGGGGVPADSGAAGRDVVVDGGGVGQGQAHDTHRPSAVRMVVRRTRGRAWTVRSGVPVLKSANSSATVPLYRATVRVGVKAVMSAVAAAVGSQRIS